VTGEEAKARWICCPMCDKARCERGADDCDVKRYLKNKAESEVEDVLTKIRAEIEAEPYISKMEVLDIIDRYKTERE
jgi:uncharacterized metal-binding protein